MPTGVGVEVNTRSDGGNRARLAMLVGAIVFVTVLGIGAVAFTRSSKPKIEPAAAGLVPSAAGEASTARVVLEPAPPPPVGETAAPSASVAATPPTTKPSTVTGAAKPTSRPATSAQPPKGPSQYGAAGVSTAY